MITLFRFGLDIFISLKKEHKIRTLNDFHGCEWRGSYRQIEVLVEGIEVVTSHLQLHLGDIDETTWRDVPWRAWHNMIWRDLNLRYVSWRHMPWYDMIWHDMAWRDVTWTDRMRSAWPVVRINCWTYLLCLFLTLKHKKRKAKQIPKEAMTHIKTNMMIVIECSRLCTLWRSAGALPPKK